MKALVFLVAVSFGIIGAADGAEQADNSEIRSLNQTIAELDAAAFDAFNHCADPARLKKHGEYFSEDVEFYHDTGGVTWSRKAMLANTKKYVCGHFRRELIPGTLRVFPIKGFGAISQGSHRFCQFASGECEGMADFTVVWRQKAGHWQITRVLSYGHRAIAEEPKHAN